MFRFVGCTALSCCLAAPTFAGESSLPQRAGSWIQQNQRGIVRQLGREGLQLSFGNLGEGAGSGPGISYFQPRLEGSALDLYVARAWSVDGDSLYNVRLGRVPHMAGQTASRRLLLDRLAPSLIDGSNARRLFAYAELRRQTVVDGRLYDAQGLASPFDYEEQAADVVVGGVLAPRLVASLRAGWLETQARLDAAPRTASAPAPVDGRERSFFATTVALAYDRRDRPADPRAGGFVELSLGRYHGLGRRAASFDRLSVDARRYIALGSERHVLALRGLVGLTGSEDRESAPWLLQHGIGGARGLRAFRTSRFRGPRLAAVAAEYRASVRGPLGVAAFYEAGRVWGGAGEPRTRGFASSYGVGVMLRSNDRVLVRVDAARGAEGTRFNVSFGHSF